MSILRRFTLSLAITAAFVLAAGSSHGLHGAGRDDVHLTPGGYRVPVYGMSAIRDAQGNVGTECARLTNAQIESARLARPTSRAMTAMSPRSIVQATTTGLAFQVVYTDPSGTGFNDPREGAARKRALEAAFAAWSKVLQGTVTIVVEAAMEDQDPDSTLLASAGPVDFFEIDGKAMPSALAAQLARASLNGGSSDIAVSVNPAMNWDYAENGVAARDKASFVYTLIHEIGHGLGFIDSFDSETGELLNPIPFPYDAFVNRGSGRANLVMRRSADQVIADLVSNDLFFSGPKAVEASKKSIRPLPMVKLYAPDPYEQGSSVSHVDQDTYADFKTGLMTPQDFGSGTDKIDILTLGVMADMGYELVPNAVTARTPR